MRKHVKKIALNVITILHESNEKIKKAIEQNDIVYAQSLLADSQENIIRLGEAIEKSEGEGFVTVSYIEEYCERLYAYYEELGTDTTVNANKVYKVLRKYLMQIESSIRNDIPVKLEVVFLPYKASMWDSMESVWMAAAADDNCDAYVLPIPYYDKNPDGSFKCEHWEIQEYPDYVPVVNCKDYDFESRRPDMIFIHNPYDDYNTVTSVHPDFFSRNLKKYTDALVYIPYFATSGSMDPHKGRCPACYHADYIIMQSERYRAFYDPVFSEDKLLALGSPKYDRAIRVCANPPAPPAEWQDRLQGKKVYFYNTSISGMLGNTDVFLNKMEYVFRCFKGRDDVCLIWRPHPLLESSFDSMRAYFKPRYQALKAYFIDNDLGIYDTTPDVTDTIALCDAYVGDSGSSLVSIFGIVGKPTFIFRNSINSEADVSCINDIMRNEFCIYGDMDMMITNGNKLYQLDKARHTYRYMYDISDEYKYDFYYSHIVSVGDKRYLCPMCAQDILEIDSNGIKKKIELERRIGNTCAFGGAIASGKYLMLIPQRYSAVVRYDTESGEIVCIGEHLEIFKGDVPIELRVSRYCVQDGYLFMASPSDNRILVMHIETGKIQVCTTRAANTCGCFALASDGTELWLLPYKGNIITRWNPMTGEVKEYTCPADLQCRNVDYGYECQEKPFGYPAFYGDYIYIPAHWGNMHLKINMVTDEVEKWELPIELPQSPVNGYIEASGRSHFLYNKEKGKVCKLYSGYDKKLYDIDLEANTASEVELKFDIDELKVHEPGFCEQSEWLQYACMENAFNTLPDFLDGKITGNQHDKERQMVAFRKIAANNDGTCGEKVYQHIRARLLE